MADKILVADDSLTIQKVVAITLANEPWVLVEATDESELFGKLRGGDYSIVLLDFNLSESKTGYELAQEIKSISPHAKVLAMLGTFDSVDEAELDRSGADGKIVKPFDSNKFIQKCRELINDQDNVSLTEAEEESLGLSEDDSLEGSSDDEPLEDNTDSQDDSDEWVMDSPSVNQDDSDDDSSSDSDTWEEDTAPSISLDSLNETSDSDPLSSELEGWGVSIPDPIGAKDTKDKKVPPVIDSGLEKDFLWEDSSEESEAAVEDLQFQHEADSTPSLVASSSDDEETVYPETDDLDYPDFDALSVGDDNAQSVTPKPSSQMISLDELSADEDELPLQLVREEDQSERADLAKEIEAELSPDDFWAADDSTKNELSLGNDDEDGEDDSRESFVVGVGDPLAPIDPVKPSEKLNVEVNNQKNFVQDFDEDAIVKKVTDALAPMIEDIVKRYMEEKVEKVAWEVIPDVAENLIRKEIQLLSQATRDS